MSDGCILLFSSLSTDQIQVVNTRRMEDLLIGHKIVFEKIDGTDPTSKEVRDKLFAVSEKRGKYPQLFIVKEDNCYEFVGLWEEVESLSECESIPSDVLAANPQIKTLSKVFENVKKQ